MAVGRSFASIKGYQLDGNREMFSMGIMNIAGSLSSCYVATGNVFCSILRVTIYTSRILIRYKNELNQYESLGK
jgi:low affinity sulfate transporter 2